MGCNPILEEGQHNNAYNTKTTYSSSKLSTDVAGVNTSKSWITCCNLTH